MKTLTPKQRREIYLKAAIWLVARPEPKACMCPAIGYALNGNDLNYDMEEFLEQFPEFALFQPSAGADRWYNEGDQKGDRLTALLLMSEMCKP